MTCKHNYPQGFALAVFISMLFGLFMSSAHAQSSQDLNTLPSYSEQWRFKDLANQRALRVDGLASVLNLGFGSRLDRVVVDGELSIKFRYSPTLVKNTSQLRIRFNDEIVTSILLPQARANELHTATIKLPAQNFARYNEVRFELLAEAEGDQCAVLSASAWLEFTADSHISIQSQQLAIADELSWFPRPFYDPNNFAKPELQFVLPTRVQPELVEALGLLTSYFASQANWRGVATQIHRYKENFIHDNWNDLEAWPAQHAIAFMTNEQRPWPFQHLDDVTEPTLYMVANPRHKAFKVLLIHAPTGAELVPAVYGLIQHRDGISGPVATVYSGLPEPRAAYSAPRWLSTKRPVTFSELVDYPLDLQRRGYANAPISINLNLPPDLFTWQRRGIPIDLKFRYTPPIEKDESRLKVFVNDDFVKGYTLHQDGSNSVDDPLRVPLIELNPFAQPSLEIPSFKLGAVNRLDFEFTFSARTEECRVKPLGNTLGAIDGNSTIDLRGYDNYVQMPNLRIFTKTGYPFSRYDDLNQTLVVMPTAPSDAGINSYLKVTSIIAGSTGSITPHVTVLDVDAVPANSNKDVLIIGEMATKAWLDRFGDEQLSKQLAHHGLAGREALFAFPETVGISGPSATIVAFQSGLNSQASVIALTATRDDYLHEIIELLDSPERSLQVSGFMTVVTPGHQESLTSYEAYYVGDLSLMNRIYFHLARYPVLVAVLALLAILTLAMLVYWALARRAQRRLQSK